MPNRFLFFHHNIQLLYTLSLIIMGNSGKTTPLSKRNMKILEIPPHFSHPLSASKRWEQKSSTNLILINRHFACHEKADVLARLHLKGLSSPHRPKTVSKILPFWWWEPCPNQACWGKLGSVNNKTMKRFVLKLLGGSQKQFDNIGTCQRIVIIYTQSYKLSVNFNI